MLTFDDRRVDLRRSVIYVSIFEDQWSMCRPSKIDGRCEIRLLYLLKTLILYISCMRITPRVCTSVLSLYWGYIMHTKKVNEWTVTSERSVF